MNNALVSLVTVCYNSEKTIERTIKSVFNQIYDNIEYIIVDGDSTDRTMKIIERYRQAFGDKLKVMSEPDKGIYDAMNKGINLCNGQYIGIINSDDWYEEDAVEKVVEAFRVNDCDVVYGAMRFWKNDYLYSIKYMSHEFLEEKMINHPTCFVKGSLYKTYGVFDTSYKVAADYELLLRFKKKGADFYGIKEVISNFTYGGISNRENDYLSDREKDKVWLQYNMITKKKCMLKNMMYNLKVIFKRATRV